MCNRQFPEAFQFGDVNGPLQTWVSQKDAQVVQISCRDKERPQLRASYIEREEIMDLCAGGGWDGFSLCTQADLKLTVFLSQPPACCDHRQAPPCLAFNLILINVTKSWESDCRGEEHVCSLQWDRHLQYPIRHGANARCHNQYQCAPFPGVNTT